MSRILLFTSIHIEILQIFNLSHLFHEFIKLYVYNIIVIVT